MTLLGVNAYSQSSQDEIPEAVKAKAADFLSYAGGGCGSVPEITLVGKKLEDRKNRSGFKDGIKDSVFLYQINNLCTWRNVPSHFTYIFAGKKGGAFESAGSFDESGILSRDEKDKPVIPKEW